MNFEISLFRFDYKSDYLPYYTKHFIKISKEITLLDLLNTINKEQNFSFEKDDEFCLVVNNIYLKANTSLDDIYKNFSNELTIEPISIKRAKNDLIINEDDFYSKLEILNNYIDESHIKKYENFKIYYYASNTLNFFDNYIGDALALVIFDLLQEKPNLKDTLLKILKDHEYSLNYHTSLKNRVYNIKDDIEEKINYLQNLLKYNTPFKYKELLTFKYDNLNDEIKYDFKDFNYSYIGQNEQHLKFIDRLKGKNIKLFSLNNDLALNCFSSNKEISLKVASDILLDVFDNGADFLVCQSQEEFYLFDYYHKQIEKNTKRQIPLKILCFQELVLLAYGKFDEVKPSLKKHSIKIDFI